jgi:hypothetical protein
LWRATTAENAMEHELRFFEEMLARASGCIGPEYFQLPLADADAVYRERVYCYELYHQLRCLWDGFPFSLGGEVDKGGHPRFQNGPYAHAKPDLLVHVPGNMDANLACIEVKPIGRPVAEFTADLRKLTWFCQNANYYRGIFLVYGEAKMTKPCERSWEPPQERRTASMWCAYIFFIMREPVALAGEFRTRVNGSILESRHLRR